MKALRDKPRGEPCERDMHHVNMGSNMSSARRPHLLDTSSALKLLLPKLLPPLKLPLPLPLKLLLLLKSLLLRLWLRAGTSLLLYCSAVMEVMQ